MDIIDCFILKVKFFYDILNKNLQNEEILRMKKLLCFDVDGTLTEKRTKIKADNFEFLEELSKKYKLLIVSSGNCERIYEQLNRFPVEILGNFGLQQSAIIDGKFTVVKQNRIEMDKESFLSRIAYLRKKYGYETYQGESVDFHPSGMATFGLLGTKASIEDKLAFDPDRSKRMAFYDEVKELFPEYDVYVGGSTSFDFGDKRFNKYTAIKQYAQENGYAIDEILYIGDEDHVGGGDYPVFASEIDAIKITHYTKVKEQLQFLLL